MAAAAIAHIQLNTGQKVSAGLHVGLILWVMLFDLFSSPDDSRAPDVTEVSLISLQDFAEMTQVQEVTPAPAAPAAPAPRPEPITPPEPIAPPAPVAPPAPITPPPPVEPAPVAPPAPEPPQAAVIAPQTTPQASLTPVQRPAERVAPQAAPTPEPEITIAPTDQAAIAPDNTAVIRAPEAQEATQREAAATETVTEATRISETEPAQRTATAPEVSLRPRTRPPAPAAAPVAAPAPTPAPQQTAAAPAPTPAATGPSSSAIEDALAEALAGALGEPAALAASDVDALRLNIESCWNVGILSTEALNVVITIAFEMTADARPIESTIRQVSATGGSFPAQQAAFDAGRQAIVQCGTQGYGLPQDLYDQWRLVEITFNPARMSTR